MSSTIDAISIIVESRDPYTAGHQRRVTQLATAIAGDMGLSDEKIDLIRMGSLIHDIGKIYIPAEILTKPTRLNDIELSLIKSHPLVGYNILKQVDFIPAIVDMVYQHHEKIDGSGYPLGISGDEILLELSLLQTWLKPWPATGRIGLRWEQRLHWKKSNNNGELRWTQTQWIPA